MTGAPVCSLVNHRHSGREPGPHYRLRESHMTMHRPGPTWQEDHTGFRYPGPAVEAPSQTILWRARVALGNIHELLEQITQHSDVNQDVVLQVEAIADRFMRVTAGARVKPSEVPWLEEAEQQLRAILAGIAPTGPVAPQTTVLVEHATPDADTGEIQVPVLILAERRHLPVPSRWLWRDRPARRRIRAWKKAWCLLQHDPVDLDKVLAAWQAYGRVVQPPPPTAQLGPALNPQPESA
jgi:hypothetical protein